MGREHQPALFALLGECVNALGELISATLLAVGEEEGFEFGQVDAAVLVRVDELEHQVVPFFRTCSHNARSANSTAHGAAVCAANRSMEANQQSCGFMCAEA